MSFTQGQWNMIENLRGKFGDSDSQIIRAIVISWLAEKSILSSSVKLELDRSSLERVNAPHETKLNEFK